ncbi:TIGR02679 family protein [Streptomyces sp. NPDC002853]
MTAPSDRLSEPLRSYLAHPSLHPLWAAVRLRLERNRLTATGSLQITLGEEAAHRLAGLLGTPITAGSQRLSLKRLDESLRASAAACGLVTALSDLTGSALHDRAAARDQHQAERSSLWQHLDAELARTALASAPWASDWISTLRSSRLLSRCTPQVATSALSMAVEALSLLPALTGIPDPSGGHGWELAELAAVATHDAHGLDDGTLAGALTLQAIALAHHQPLPTTARDRRQLWERAGATTDLLSSTVLTWHLDPPGPSPWSRMLRQRTALGLATHLTAQELRSAPAAHSPLARPDSTIFACENPQVLQAAMRNATTAPLICTSGNPSHATWILLERLVAEGNHVVYHGDFDWSGIAIATRIYAAGIHPWRMTASDYCTALSTPAAPQRLPLVGTAQPTPWDRALSPAMQDAGTAVHEESQLPLLLSEMGISTRPPER